MLYQTQNTAFLQASRASCRTLRLFQDLCWIALLAQHSSIWDHELHTSHSLYSCYEICLYEMPGCTRDSRATAANGMPTINLHNTARSPARPLPHSTALLAACLSSTPHISSQGPVSLKASTGILLKRSGFGGHNRTRCMRTHGGLNGWQVFTS